MRGQLSRFIDILPIITTQQSAKVISTPQTCRMNLLWSSLTKANDSGALLSLKSATAAFEATAL